MICIACCREFFVRWCIFAFPLGMIPFDKFHRLLDVSLGNRFDLSSPSGSVLGVWHPKDGQLSHPLGSYYLVVMYLFREPPIVVLAL
jgi:hypothetical protein